MKFYMFRAVPPSIIRSVFTVHSALVYVIPVCRQLSSRSRSCSKAVWHIPLLSVQWIHSCWWTEELSETCRVSWQNKFVKLVNLVGFIIKKFCSSVHHQQFNTVHSAIVYVIQLSSRTWSCSTAVYKPVWHIPVPSVQWIHSWWWTGTVRNV